MALRKLAVLFGSQTGTSHDVADRVVREAKRRHYSARAVAMDDYNVTELIHEGLVVFVCSTTGQGDPPDNMKMFWKFLLRKDLPASSLCNLQFAVLGLGDSSYQKFNVVGKRLQKRLEQLGGHSIMKLGLADDQHDLGIDAVVAPWLTNVWQTILDIYPLPIGLVIISSEICPPSKYKVKFLDDHPLNRHKIENTVLPQLSTRRSDHEEKIMLGPLCPFHAQLISNKRVTDLDHFQDVRLVKFDIKDSGITYSPGDVVMIQPQNSANTVQEFMDVLGLDSAKLFTLEQTDPDTTIPPGFPTVCSVQWLVTHYLDINSVPRRSFFELLTYLADDEMEKEKLQEFCTPEGQEELYTYCNRVKRTILEILQDFSNTSARIPFEFLFDLIPPLQPRAFSIASAPTAHPGELHLLMAVVEYKTKLQRPRRGVCSTWLASLTPSQDCVVPLWVKQGTIRFPADLSVPLVMVGPGTGLAPFRSVIQERCAHNTGDSVLFFGCRSEGKDFFCRDEWTELVNRGLVTLYTAFSRDQEDKIYVQHRVIEHGQLVWKMLSEKKAYFYIAGNAKSMPEEVKSSLTEVVSTEGCMTSKEAATFIQSLERCRRFQVEAWS